MVSTGVLNHGFNLHIATKCRGIRFQYLISNSIFFLIQNESVFISINEEQVRKQLRMWGACDPAWALLAILLHLVGITQRAGDSKSQRASWHFAHQSSAQPLILTESWKIQRSTLCKMIKIFFHFFMTEEKGHAKSQNHIMYKTEGMCGKEKDAPASGCLRVSNCGYQTLY